MNRNTLFSSVVAEIALLSGSLARRIKQHLLSMILVMLFVLFSNSQLRCNDSTSLEKIQIRYVSWDIIAETPITVKSLLRDNPHLIDTITLNQEQILSTYCYLLNQKRDTINIDCDEIRMLIIIHRKNNTSDTLLFGNCPIMILNKKNYKVDIKLLELVFPYIKDYRKEPLEEYIKLIKENP